jgi:hypothetical protein
MLRSLEILLTIYKAVRRHNAEGHQLKALYRLYPLFFSFLLSVLQKSIASGYGLDDRVIEIRSSAEAKGFFF